MDDDGGRRGTKREDGGRRGMKRDESDVKECKLSIETNIFEILQRFIQMQYFIFSFHGSIHNFLCILVPLKCSVNSRPNCVALKVFNLLIKK